MRSAVLLWLVAAILFPALLPARGQSHEAATSPNPRSVVLRVSSTVSDVERSVAFYRDVLSFHVDSDDERPSPAHASHGVFAARTRTVRMSLGTEPIELVEFKGPKGRARRPAQQSNDLSFQHLAIVVSDMDRAYERVRAAGVEHVSPEPQRIPDSNVAAGGIRAFYFRDADGHPLELIWYPPGKGARRWQDLDGRLFLGIDHTAITVRDTDASVAFYRDVLGFRVVGGSLNGGIEQELLSGLRGAQVRITALAIDGGMGVELLQYLAPATGRPFPQDTRANDLIHRHVAVRLADDRGLRESLAIPVGRAFRVRDPDGHVVEIAPEEKAR